MTFAHRDLVALLIAPDVGVGEGMSDKKQRPHHHFKEERMEDSPVETTHRLGILDQTARCISLLTWRCYSPVDKSTMRILARRLLDRCFGTRARNNKKDDVRGGVLAAVLTHEALRSLHAFRWLSSL
jgi:hypothetical protein